MIDGTMEMILPPPAGKPGRRGQFSYQSAARLAYVCSSFTEPVAGVATALLYYVDSSTALRSGYVNQSHAVLGRLRK